MRALNVIGNKTTVEAHLAVVDAAVFPHESKVSVEFGEAPIARALDLLR